MDRVALPRRRRPSRPLVVTVAVLVGLPAVVLAWYFFLATVDPAPYVADIDALPVPSAWEVVHTQPLRSILGSRGFRWYLVDGEPQEITPVVLQVLASAGFEVYTPGYPQETCDTPPLGATPAATCPVARIGTCEENGLGDNGLGGPVDCHVQAFRWLSLDPPLLERVAVNVWHRGESFTVGVSDDQHDVEASNRALVVINVDHAEPRYFWASPTPRAS